MNKIDRLAYKYVLYVLPLVGVLLVWGLIEDPTALSVSTGTKRIVWDFLGWFFMAWVALSFYLSVRLVLSSENRNAFLKRLVKIKDSDEREEYITGQAAKFSLLSSVAILFMFLFLSLIRVSVNKDINPTEGKKGSISIGMNITPFQVKDNSIASNESKEVFAYSGMPLSNFLLILFLIFWQLGSYRLSLRESFQSV